MKRIVPIYSGKNEIPDHMYMPTCLAENYTKTKTNHWTRISL